MDAPTCEDLYEEDGYHIAHEEIIEPWRWGNLVSVVYKRDADNTYWEASYRRSTEGEIHGLRDGDAEIGRVVPGVKTVPCYIPWTGVVE